MKALSNGVTNICRCICTRLRVQDELVSAGLVKPPSDAAFADKAKSKARKALRRSSGGSDDGSHPDGFRQYTSPDGLQVGADRRTRQACLLCACGMHICLSVAVVTELVFTR